MGTNLFVEGRPAPVVVSIRLTRPISSFPELRQVASGLATVDTLRRNWWSDSWPGYGSRSRRETHLLSFRLESPPVFQVLADPAWIAVFLIILTGYKQGKESVQEFGRDISTLVDSVKGLTERELQLLKISVRLSLEHLASSVELGALKVAKKMSTARKKLVGESEELPEISVADIENRHRHW